MRITERLNEIEKEIKELNSSEAICKAITLAQEYGKEEVVECFVDDEIMGYMTKNRLEISGWQGVACFLSKVNCISEDFYYIDGYENANNISVDSINNVLYELKESLKDEIEEEPIHEGDKFIITDTDDVDLINWYESQENKILIAKKVEFDVWGIWVDNCDYRIDISEIEKIKE